MKLPTLISSLILAILALTLPTLTLALPNSHPNEPPTPPTLETRPTATPTARGAIVFASPNRPDIELLVRTQWHIQYPGRLRAALMEAGFVIVEGRTERRCGWWDGSGVWAAGVKRGMVAWRARYGTDEGGDGGREKGREEEEEAEPPGEEVLELVREVLRSTYPALEIALVVVGAAGAPFWVLLAGWVVWWVMMEIWCCLRGW
ncbi:hypothetical protein H2199_004147 [Coniosporium tulheliwenetii]|uniref:Uncharacterized protein n=1 Tax=Coniosporium tulheliwenetii TaxID=3383036 RepID=A0ACC2Z7E6_9PEZI|nr:hypothetical protein H2199_004147 [Cladosporium sp. JES 115]